MKKSAVMKSMKSLLKNKLVLYAVLAISGLHAFNLFLSGKLQQFNSFYCCFIVIYIF